MECPVARSLEEVGEWWSILILRDAMLGLRRFDEFQRSLGVAPTTLTRRLTALVENGLLVRHRYSQRPPRDEYVLTDKGRDFHPVVVALLAWGNRHLAGPAGPALVLIDRDNGAVMDPIVVDAATREPIAQRRAVLTAGPGAGPEIHERLRIAAQRRKANG